MTQATRIRTCPQCRKTAPSPTHYFDLNGARGCWIKLGYSKERGQSWLRVGKPNG